MEQDVVSQGFLFLLYRHRKINLKPNFDYDSAINKMKQTTMGTWAMFFIIEGGSWLVNTYI